MSAISYEFTVTVTFAGPTEALNQRFYIDDVDVIRTACQHVAYDNLGHYDDGPIVTIVQVDSATLASAHNDEWAP
jgi:hypothetical protein